MNDLMVCLCGYQPVIQKEEDGRCAYVCPQCYYAPEHFSRDKSDARKSWNSLVKHPRRVKS